MLPSAARVRTVVALAAAWLLLAGGTTLSRPPRAAEAQGRGSSARPAARPSAEEPPAGLSRTEWGRIRGAIEASRYHASPVARPGEAPALVARNRTQRYRTEFRREGIEIASTLAPGEDWRLGVRVTGYGYAGQVRPLPLAEPVAEKERVEYRRGPVTEWYVNRPEGLEQGFTIAKAPTGGVLGPLAIELTVHGHLRAAVEGDRAVFADTSGRTVVRYAGLRAWDAGGQELPSRMEAAEVGLRLLVQAGTARFPVTVDPRFVREAKLEGHSDPEQAGAQAGYSVSVSGDTAVVGAPYHDTAAGADAGAAYAFVRSGTAWSQQQKLTAPDGAASDRFGWSVSVSGDTAVVGAPYDDTTRGVDAGSAYVFVRGAGVWSQQQTLAGADTGGGDQFGESVAVEGNTVVVGAPNDVVLGPPPAGGSAYVFVRAGTTWSQQQKLVDPPGAYNDIFGTSVAVSGDTAVIGAAGKFGFMGVAFVFVRSGTVWSQQQMLTGSDGGGQLGWSVSISGDTAVLGAYAADSSRGAAYVFLRSGTVWSQQQRLTASDGAATDLFGYSVAVSGDRAVVGSYGDDTAGGANAGSAYVFVRSGTVWTQQQKLTASDAAADDRFGVSVAVSGDTAIVGAYLDDVGANADQGSASALVRAGASWTQQQKLTPTDRQTGDSLGASVSVSGDTAVVGAPYDDTAAGVDAGSVYVFVRIGRLWSEQQKLTASDAAAGDKFGFSLSVSGDTAVVGAPYDDTAAGVDAGSAYVFVRSGTVWSQQQKLEASAATESDGLGWSVSVSGDTAVVGAPYDEPFYGVDVGSAYVFVRSGTVWTQQQMLTDINWANNDDNFGISVSVSGDTVVVGVWRDHSWGLKAGSAHVFVRSGTVWSLQDRITTGTWAADARFGRSVSISGDTAVVGAPYADTAAGADAGSAYVFVRSGTLWSQPQELTHPYGAAGDGFGLAVSVSGDTAVVGAPFDDIPGVGANAGSATVFQRSGTVWSWQAWVSASDRAAGDSFGLSVSASGDTVVIGADDADTAGAADAGAAYVDREASADLSLTLADAPDPATGLGSVTYTVVVSNAGPSESIGLTVTQSIISAPPTGVPFQSASGTGWSCLAGSWVVTCTRPSLVAGASAPSLTIQWALGPAGGTLVAQATVASYDPDPQTGNNTATATTTVNGVPYTDLSISKNDGGVTALWNRPLTYTLTVSNAGPGAVTGATVTDSFPASVAAVAWTCTASAGSSCPASGSGNINTTVNLAVGGTATFTATGTVVWGTAGPMANTAAVSSPIYDTATANNFSTINTPVNTDLVFKDGFQ